MPKKLRIFAFGGNEVSPTGLVDKKTGKMIIPDIAMQWQKTAQTCRLVADIIERHPDDLYVITHGNGPQVGNILLRAEYARSILHPLPLDICGADTQGAMGYMIAQLAGELKMRGIDRTVAETVTQVVVDKDDPDFKNPSKYIGSAYSKRDAMKLAEKDGWNVKLYKKDGEGKEIWRRVVPSPEPRDIVEIAVVESNLKAGIIPITVGGGGIPVTQVAPRIEQDREIYETNYGIKFSRKYVPAVPAAEIYRGVEAVVDKDLASALLGIMLKNRAKAAGEDLEVSFTIFTGEDGVKLNYQTPVQTDLRSATLAELEQIYARVPCPFPAGSMGPKVKAVINFLRGGGQAAYITKTELFEDTLAGKAGTTVYV